jgi:transposase-like protein
MFSACWRAASVTDRTTLARGNTWPGHRCMPDHPPTRSEERTLRRLASARHAPASLIQPARIITASWDGASVTELAQRLGCHLKTVYKWLHRFNAAQGIDGLADLPRPGLLRRLTEHERGRVIQLTRAEPPGRLHQGGEGLLALTGPGCWSSGSGPGCLTWSCETSASRSWGGRVPRTYDAEFRRRVVELVRAGRPVRVVAAELGWPRRRCTGGRLRT